MKINIITLVSEISGVIYTLGRKQHRSLKRKVVSFSDLRTINPTNPMVFEDANLEDMRQLHHDVLGISLEATDYDVKRILIDGGSLTNLLFLPCCKIMK